MLVNHMCINYSYGVGWICQPWPQPRMGLVNIFDPPEIPHTPDKTHLDPAEFCPFSKYCAFKEENCSVVQVQGFKL